jgi:hypothetical protein
LGGAQAAADFQAVELGEHDIQHHQGGTQAFDRAEGCLPIFNRVDAIALTLQIHLRELYDGRFVVYEEDVVVGHG